MPSFKNIYHFEEKYFKQLIPQLYALTVLRTKYYTNVGNISAVTDYSFIYHLAHCSPLQIHKECNIIH